MGDLERDLLQLLLRLRRRRLGCCPGLRIGGPRRRFKVTRDARAAGREARCTLRVCGVMTRVVKREKIRIGG